MGAGRQRLQAQRCRRRPGGQQWHHVGVRQAQCPEVRRGSAELGLPASVTIGYHQLLEDQFGDPVQQRVTVCGVPVQGHRADGRDRGYTGVGCRVGRSGVRPGRRGGRGGGGCAAVADPDGVWLARKVVHKIIGIAVSVAAAAGTHAGMQTWIHHLISTATQLNVGGRTSSCWTSDGSASARKTTVGAG